MFSTDAISKPFVSGGLVLMALLMGAAAVRPLERAIGELGGVRELQTEQMQSLAGKGGALALLGGLRSAVASGFWLQTNLAWERDDREATMGLIELTVAADERPLYFWENGARMIAYDMPEWLPKDAPLALRIQRNREQAEIALRFLEKGLRWHGASADLYVEMANIHLRRLGDVEAAARFYRLAAEQPEAPYYAARIYAELLIQQGRRIEALAWLREIVGKLPKNNPAARRDIVEARIGALESELGRQ